MESSSKLLPSGRIIFLIKKTFFDLTCWLIKKNVYFWFDYRTFARVFHLFFKCQVLLFPYWSTHLRSSPFLKPRLQRKQKRNEIVGLSHAKFTQLNNKEKERKNFLRNRQKKRNETSEETRNEIKPDALIGCRAPSTNHRSPFSVTR